MSEVSFWFSIQANEAGSLDIYKNAPSLKCLRETTLANRMCIASSPGQTHAPRPPRRPRRSQHAVRPQSGSVPSIYRVATTSRPVSLLRPPERCQRHDSCRGDGGCAGTLALPPGTHLHLTCTYLPASKTLGQLQVMNCTGCADRSQRGQPTALLVLSVGRVGECCCCG